MHEINDLIVRDGKVVLTHLPYPDGHHVRVMVLASEEPPAKRISVAEIRRALKGSVGRFENPLEPMIPSENWEMLK
jgi:hypothetical protein